jgi:hypothetical protein
MRAQTSLFGSRYANRQSTLVYAGCHIPTPAGKVGAHREGVQGSHVREEIVQVYLPDRTGQVDSLCLLW